MTKQPAVGIFWLVGKKLLVDSTLIDQAEDYAQFKVHGRDHIDQWGLLQTRGVVSRATPYEAHPRGRITYNKKTDQYLLLADRCILKRPKVVSRIMKQLCLPLARTTTRTDEHYRCRACLRSEL